MKYIIVMLIIMSAGVVQGASGFGFGLVALGLLSLITNIQEASIMLAITGLSINLILLWRLKKYYKIDKMLPITISAAIGVPFGVLFLLDFNSEIIRKSLGIVLFIAFIQRMIPHIKGKCWSPLWLGIPAGLLGGAFSGAFGSGGPPVVAYTASQNFEKHRYVACVQSVLGIGGISRIIFLGIGGAFTREMLYLSFFGIFFAMAGASLGTILLKKISDEFLKIIINVLLAILSVKYLFDNNL